MTFIDKSLKNKNFSKSLKKIEDGFNKNSNYFEKIMNEIKEYSKRAVNFQTIEDKIKKEAKIKFTVNEFYYYLNKDVHM